jgi:hypothetical protein
LQNRTIGPVLRVVESDTVVGPVGVVVKVYSKRVSNERSVDIVKPVR